MNHRFLLDTSVVSIFGPGRREASDDLVAWVRQQNERLFLSSITIFEITQGIARLARAEQHQRADRFTRWRDDLAAQFGERQLPVDEAVAKVGGRMSDEAFGSGMHPGFLDVLIAATARVHDLIVLTRNVRHFGTLGVAVADPLERLPD
ncbi:type II toxin-antitoxin system VapC family toxin [Devosia sp.]|uniref:type II toxin-antitoxin system VapC family toxin n=1 Tax=Devosia sp. TaxID=1871048 RepID=UPI0035B44336